MISKTLTKMMDALMMKSTISTMIVSMVTRISSSMTMKRTLVCDFDRRCVEISISIDHVDDVSYSCYEVNENENEIANDDYCYFDFYHHHHHYDDVDYYCYYYFCHDHDHHDHHQ